MVIIINRFNESIQYIHEHISEELSVADLARKLHISTDYYSRLFKQVAKCRPVEYIQRMRVEKAQLLLATTNYSIETIAELTGLGNVSYLSRLFKRYTGISPGKYRKSGFK